MALIYQAKADKLSAIGARYYPRSHEHFSWGELLDNDSAYSRAAISGISEAMAGMPVGFVPRPFVSGAQAYWETPKNSINKLIRTGQSTTLENNLSNVFNSPNRALSVGAMARREYQAAPYHGKIGNTIKSKAPTNAQDALDISVQVKTTSPRRVGVDYETGEFVIFDQTTPGVFHGHVRDWKDMTSQMQNALRDAGIVDRKGNIIRGDQ